ncbi:hypothetical protein ACFY2M_37160 [Streptomyces sp. NPDC001276]|uniref:hypothetical protein n=1 Tax=Streptomyces sp. NPDC001276 TaxID=3364555 RepID=UPI0036BF4442
MASLTHTHIRTAKHRRPAVEDVSAELLSRNEASSEERDWPTDTQVWHWAQSAVLSGYGPAASNFF